MKSTHPLQKYYEDRQEAADQLRRNTYQGRGIGVGAALGGIGGASLTAARLAQGIKAGRTVNAGKAAKVAALVTAGGAAVGAGLGKIVGSYFPRKKPKPRDSLFSAGVVERLRHLDARLDHLVEFGPLGSRVKWHRPLAVKTPSLPGGIAAYSPASAQRFGKATSPQARSGGALFTSTSSMTKGQAAISGYPSISVAENALKRHEIVHSIQSAKRGYRTHSRIRDLLRDEIGAYATMDRGVKGGSKILRGVDKVGGVGISTAVGTVLSPRLRKRAAAYGAGAAALGGAGYLALRKKKEDKRK